MDMHVRVMFCSIMKTVTGASPLPDVLREIPSRFTLISRAMFSSLLIYDQYLPKHATWPREPAYVSN